MTRLYQEDNSQYSYAMDEPLALVAGLHFLSNLEKDYLSEKIISRMFGDRTCNPQRFGFLFELLLAFRCLKPWWHHIPDDDEIWIQLPAHVKHHFRTLPPPKQIINQKRKTDDGTDWSLLNFQTSSEYFVLPDNNLGPDGIYDTMVFNCKTSQGPTVSSAECEKNFTKSDLGSWCKSDDIARKLAFKDNLLKKHLVFFQLEFPYPNPMNTKRFETNSQRTIIPLHLDSSITKFIFPQTFLVEWRNHLNRQ